MAWGSLQEECSLSSETPARPPGCGSSHRGPGPRSKTQAPPRLCPFPGLAALALSRLRLASPLDLVAADPTEPYEGTQPPIHPSKPSLHLPPAPFAGGRGVVAPGPH